MGFSYTPQAFVLRKSTFLNLSNSGNSSEFILFFSDDLFEALTDYAIAADEKHEEEYNNIKTRLNKERLR